MKEEIRAKALELGFDQCGFANSEPPLSARQFQDWIAAGKQGEMAYLARNEEKRIDPQKVLPGAKSVVSLAVSYATAVENYEPPRGFGVVARYARYRDYHDTLARLLAELARWMDQTGPRETRSLWYVDTGPLLERDLAQRSGIGFVGKHTNLISRNLGNWFFICEILTTLELTPDVPGVNRCGSCTRCLQACPTGAITAPFQLDARQCISYLTIELKGPIPLELRAAIGNRVYGCDDCLAACPWNRFARQGSLMKRHARSDLSTPELCELLRLDDAGFKLKFAGTPLLRTKRRGLLRNAAVALGNTGDRCSLPALEKAAADSEPLIAEHAEWAIGEILKRARSPR